MRKLIPVSIISSRLFHRPSSIVKRQFTIFALLFLPLAACGRYGVERERSRTQFFAEVLMRESGRWIGDDGFFRNNLLQSHSPEYAEWCAMALGRIANPQTLPLLYQALRSSNAGVRAASAFAIGEIEDRDRIREQYLSPDAEAGVQLLRLLEDPSLAVRMRAVEALGKIGSGVEAAEIVRRLERFSFREPPGERAYLGFALAALGRLKDPVAVPMLERFAGSDDPDLRWRALDALALLQSGSSAPLFIKNLRSANSEVQAHAACGMGMVADAREAALLSPLLFPRREKTGEAIPLPVRICAAQSLGIMKNPDAASAIEAAVSADPPDARHPDQRIFAFHAAGALGNIARRESESALLPLLKFPGPIADKAAIALAKILRGDAERFFGLAQKHRLNGQVSESAWAQSMAALGGLDAAEELSRMLDRAAVSSLADERQALPDILSALAEMDARPPQEIWDRWIRLRDCAILPAAIAAYQDQPGIKTPWTPIIQAHAACSSSSNVQARIEILSFLRPWVREKEVQQLLGTSLKDPERNVRSAAGTLLRGAGATDISEAPASRGGALTDASSIVLAVTRKNSTIAQVETTQGTLEIELFREEAPVTVQSFVMLAKRGIYDGMELARAFPFRIEGNLPRTGFIVGRMINGEINMRSFERGSIGMAAAGGNSDSGKLFITLAPQPRLDGIHTCFGRIVSGLQAADRIGPGDRILRIHIKETIAFHDYQNYEN